MDFWVLKMVIQWTYPGLHPDRELLANDFYVFSDLRQFWLNILLTKKKVATSVHTLYNDHRIIIAVQTVNICENN